VDGGSTQVNMNGGSVAVDTEANSALAFALNDFSISVNGAAVVTDTSATLPTVTRLHIGSDDGGSNAFNGHIYSLTYVPRRMTNVELVSKTT